jgi:E3 ubiquitin-protein ligase NEDD4
MRQTPQDLKKRLMVKFDGEDGLDYGGLSRHVPLVFSAGRFCDADCLQRVFLPPFARDVQSILLLI